MLPTLKMIEIYATIWAAVGELTPPVLPLLLQERSPISVDRSTVAFEQKACASGDAEVEEGHDIPANWRPQCSYQLDRKSTRLNSSHRP